MLQFFRNIFKSKVGLGIVLAFIGLIAVAFAVGDISGSSTFGGVAGGDRVAIVGEERIGTADLLKAAQNELDRARQDDPTLSMPAFIARGGLTDVLNTLIDRAAFREFAREHGLRTGDNLINSEIRQIPAFRGPDGNFSEDVYRQVLSQQGLTDRQVRADIATAMLVQQIALPASIGAGVPNTLAIRYAQLFKERRNGTIIDLPASAFAPATAPTAAQLKTFYEGHRNLFIRPERRVIRYAVFDAKALGAAAEPTDAEIAARYKADAARYAASETRSFSQLIVPTEAAATAIRTKVAAGGTLEAAAQAAGLRVSALKDLAKPAVRSQFSATVADSVFAAKQGALAAPARSPLGWHVIRIDKVDAKPARTLAQAKGEIADELRSEKRTSGLADLASKIEGALDDGATLTEIASEYRLAVTSTKPVIATGQVYGKSGEAVAPVIAPALQNAFQMEEGEPEVTPLGDGASYLLYDVATVTPSATAPLAEIGGDVAAAWRRDEGAKAARAAADKVMAAIAKGATLAEALAPVRKPGVQSQPIDLTREQLARMESQRVPPPLALFFSMAKGTTKKLEMPDSLGWTIVSLDDVKIDPIGNNDPLIAQARQQLGQILGQEYADQLRNAIRTAVGVERNASAIEAVRKQLSGQN